MWVFEILLTLALVYALWLVVPTTDGTVNGHVAVKNPKFATLAVVAALMGAYLLAKSIFILGLVLLIGGGFLAFAILNPKDPVDLEL